MYLYFVAFKTIELGGFGHIIISLSEEITTKNYSTSFNTIIKKIKEKTQCTYASIISYQLIPDENTDK